MTSDRPRQIVEALLEAGTSGDDETIIGLLDEAKTLGLELQFDEEVETDWSDEGSGEYATVHVTRKLMLGDLIVGEMWADYCGLGGGGGTGWWVDEVASECPDEVAAIMEAAEMRIEFPSVPQTREDEDEDEDDGEP